MNAREWAQQALNVQDACNLSGVVHTFGRMMTELHEQNHGTDWINQHPLAVLFSDKVDHLTGTQGLWASTTSWAYAWAQATADGDREGFEYDAPAEAA